MNDAATTASATAAAATSARRVRKLIGRTVAYERWKGRKGKPGGFPLRAERDGRSCLAQCVTDPAHGLDQTGLAACLGLATQVADVHIEGIGGEAEVVAPDPFEDDRSGQHLA